MNRVSMNRISNHIITFAALVAIVFGFAVEVNAQRNNQRNVQRGEVAVTPPANHVVFNNAKQPTRQVKVETVTVEITPQDRRDYYNAASAFQNAVNQLKQRFHGTRDISSFEQAVRRESTAIVTPLVNKMGIDKFDALQAEYRFSVTTFETTINTAWDWGARNINRNPRGFHAAGVITDIDPQLEAELAQDLASEIQNHRTTDRVTFQRESGGPRGVYELQPLSAVPIQQAQQSAPARPAVTPTQTTQAAPAFRPLTPAEALARNNPLSQAPNPGYFVRDVRDIRDGGFGQKRIKGIPTLADKGTLIAFYPNIDNASNCIAGSLFYEAYFPNETQQPQKTDDGPYLAP